MTSKTRYVFFALTVVAAMVFTISSCAKKAGNMPPVATVNEPAQHAMVSIPDSIHFSITATDDEGLHDMSVLLISAGGDTVVKEYPYVHELLTYTFTSNFFPTTSGTYTLQVTAEDHEEENTTVTREVMVM